MINELYGVSCYGGVPCVGFTLHSTARSSYLLLCAATDPAATMLEPCREQMLLPSHCWMVKSVAGLTWSHRVSLSVFRLCCESLGFDSSVAVRNHTCAQQTQELGM